MQVLAYLGPPRGVWMVTLGGDRRREGWKSICALVSRYRRPALASGPRWALPHEIVAARREAATTSALMTAPGTVRPAGASAGDRLASRSGD